MKTADYQIYKKKNLIYRDQSRVYSKTSGVNLSRRQFEEYLDGLAESGCTLVTLQTYRRNLERLYQFLDEDKFIEEGTLEAWQEHLLETGYSVRTVNVCISAANGLVSYMGYRGLQTDRLPEKETVQPELTRAEYLRLLSIARMKGKEKVYLLIKIMGTTGLSVGNMGSMTAEAVYAGKIRINSETLRISDGLKKELLHFMETEGITSGPLFLTKEEKPMNRSTITLMVKQLCRDARVPEEKANPRCLRKLYLTTREGILEKLSLLAEQAYDKMLEKEQNIIGWEQEE